MTGPQVFERFTLPERIFAVLGTVLVAGLFVRAGVDRVSLTAAVLLLGFLIAVRVTQHVSRIRLVINFCTTVAFYSGSTAVIESLQLPLQQERLLECDRRMLGETPCVSFQALMPWWMNDLLSGGYLSYHVYLFWVLMDALRQPDRVRATYSRVVFTAFGIGFSGYFLFPSAGPSVAFPELFTTQLDGGWLTQMTLAIVDNFAARYDSFPSLHIFVSGSMMACDWRYHRRRMTVMALPLAMMVFATVFLRLHYLVDLLASAAMLVPFLLVIRREEIASK